MQSFECLRFGTSISFFHDRCSSVLCLPLYYISTAPPAQPHSLSPFEYSVSMSSRFSFRRPVRDLDPSVSSPHSNCSTPLSKRTNTSTPTSVSPHPSRPAFQPPSLQIPLPEPTPLIALLSDTPNSRGNRSDKRSDCRSYIEPLVAPPVFLSVPVDSDLPESSPQLTESEPEPGDSYLSLPTPVTGDLITGPSYQSQRDGVDVDAAEADEEEEAVLSLAFHHCNSTSSLVRNYQPTPLTLTPGGPTPYSPVSATSSVDTPLYSAHLLEPQGSNPLPDLCLGLGLAPLDAVSPSAETLKSFKVIDSRGNSPAFFNLPPSANRPGRTVGSGRGSGRHHTPSKGNTPTFFQYTKPRGNTPTFFPAPKPSAPRATRPTRPTRQTRQRPSSASSSKSLRSPLRDHWDSSYQYLQRPASSSIQRQQSLPIVSSVHSVECVHNQETQKSQEQSPETPTTPNPPRFVLPTGSTPTVHLLSVPAPSASPTPYSPVLPLGSPYKFNLERTLSETSLGSPSASASYHQHTAHGPHGPHSPHTPHGPHLHRPRSLCRICHCNTPPLFGRLRAGNSGNSLNPFHYSSHTMGCCQCISKNTIRSPRSSASTRTGTVSFEDSSKHQVEPQTGTPNPDMVPSEVLLESGGRSGRLSVPTASKEEEQDPEQIQIQINGAIGTPLRLSVDEYAPVPTDHMMDHHDHSRDIEEDMAGGTRDGNYTAHRTVQADQVRPKHNMDNLSLLEHEDTRSTLNEERKDLVSPFPPTLDQLHSLTKTQNKRLSTSDVISSPLHSVRISITPKVESFYIFK